MSESGQGPGWSAGEGAPLPPPPLGAVAPPPPGYGVAPASPYGAPSYGPPVAPTGTSGMAIGAMVCGLVGTVGGAVTCGITAPAAIVGLVLGHVALHQIKQTGQEGRGFALAGVILGWISVATILLVVVAVVIVAITDGST